MRIIFVFLLLIPFFLSAAQPAKVVGVIPVKFNSKGMHAPVPYSQQLMERGWTRVPTYNIPLATPSANPRYQPTTVTKKSFARQLGYLAGRVGSMSPASKALLIGYGAYEANCISQNYPSLCMKGDPVQGDQIQYDPNDFKTPDQKEKWCTSQYSNLNFCAENPAKANDLAIEHFIKGQTVSTSDLQLIASVASKTFNTPSTTIQYKLKRYEKRCTGYPTCNPQMVFVNETTSTWGASSVIQGLFPAACPPDAHPDYNFAVGEGSAKKCHKPIVTYSNVPVTAEWIEDQINQNPKPAVDSDIGLDDFVDWETGQPRPDAFEDPKQDPVSDAFADAAEAIANGTVQHSNPNGAGYVPADMMPNLLIQINNWHEGNTFTDVFNGKEITPETQPEEKQDVDWSKFPGLTKSQYEASNNFWGNAATKNAPNVDSEIDKLTQEQDKLKDYINEAPPPLPFEINLIDLLNLPTSNGCQGFTLPASINGEQKSIRVDQHCPPYEAWGRPVVSWVFSLFTILVCFHIFRKTLEVTF